MADDPEHLAWIRAQEKLFGNLTADDLQWVQFTLFDNLVIKVCSPVKVDGCYLPVSTKQTFDVARRYGLYPLTRAVADQIFIQAAKATDPQLAVPIHQQSEDKFNFKKRSAYLEPLYGPSQGNRLVSGAHKLWVLSAAGRATKKNSVNYGFWESPEERPKNKPDNRPNHGGGSYMNGSPYSLVQPLGLTHDADYWDYSQLLQLMKMDQPANVKGKLYSLGMCIVAGMPAVWDEPQTLSAIDLPW